MFSAFDDAALFQSVLENLPVGVYIVDRERRVRFWNHGAEHITGYLAHEVIGQPCNGRLLHCNPQGHALCGDLCPITATFYNGQPQRTIAFSLHKHGHRVKVGIETVPVFAEPELLVGVALIFQETSASAQREGFDPLSYGCIDPTTGVSSQRLTRAVLSECTAALEHCPGLGLLRIRVPGLQEFGARHGPDSVACFLRTTAQTLRQALDSSSFLGRWGEHDFVAVLDSCSPIVVAAKAESLWRLLSQSEISWWGDRFLIEAVVAHAIARPGDNLEALLQGLQPGSGRE